MLWWSSVNLKKLAKWSGTFYRRRIWQNKRKLTKMKVMDFQRDMIKMGFLDEDPDGIFGTQTEAALLRFQSRHHLKIDGLIGPQTYSRIREIRKEVN